MAGGKELKVPPTQFVSHCVYCGGRTLAWRFVCHAHNELPEIDLDYLSAVRSNATCVSTLPVAAATEDVPPTMGTAA